MNIPFFDNRAIHSRWKYYKSLFKSEKLEQITVLANNKPLIQPIQLTGILYLKYGFLNFNDFLYLIVYYHVEM